ncbi:zona pellucida sperm-binding 3-like protein [Labeo rohita]|uniref:Zona pellucida sperm-binding 3-like protein n=1 Tax=Labeo rohita TaxID=84645 RepID=A0A498LYR7_LABRO|nr:zona pellucida sperm-binding 3-like protein [Labeo rohita]
MMELQNERTDRPRTAREKHSGKLLVRDPSTNTRQRPVPVLRIRGRTPTRGAPGEDHLPTFTRLPDVAVTCSRSGFVLRVKRNFYGFSAAAEELTLGETCKSNGVLEPQNDLLFTYALNDCQGEQQVFPDYVAYKYVLHYVPLSHRNSLHHHRVNVGVECRYKREHHVHSLVMSPTSRTPLRKIIRTRSAEFQIQLMDGFVSSDQVLFSDPVTSDLSTLASSTLDSTLVAHRNDDIIWFEAKMAKEPQRSYTHKDFVASVTLIFSDDDHDKRQHTSQITTEEERKAIEEEKNEDVEIFIAISKSIVGSERPDLDSMEKLDVASLSWSGDRKMQNVTKGSSYSQKKIQRMEEVQEGKGSTKTPVMVGEIMKEHSDIDESTMGDRELGEVFPPYFTSKENNSYENKKEGLGLQVFPLDSDELIEQGVVKKLNLTQDSDDYYFSDGM